MTHKACVVQAIRFCESSLSCTCKFKPCMVRSDDLSRWQSQARLHDPPAFRLIAVPYEYSVNRVEYKYVSSSLAVLHQTKSKLSTTQHLRCTKAFTLLSPPTRTFKMRFSTAVTALFALALSVSASPLEQRQTCDITTPEYCPGDLAGCKAFVSAPGPSV